jgi:peptidoglycan/LPS O-acetylase OafA/YrhL
LYDIEVVLGCDALQAEDPMQDERPIAAASAITRDKAIDGFRAVAVLCVVYGHATAYRFADILTGPFRLLPRFAGPLSELGVQLFFVISGYIITSLLAREETRTGAVSIPAFYLRRFCRIIPPLLAYFAVLLLIRATGRIDFPPTQLLSAALFTCNTGVTQCGWWIAHTWSLAVEEQYYLCWPLLFILLPSGGRPAFLAAVAIALSIVFAFQPPVWHSNALSYACIAAGAFHALSRRSQDLIEHLAHPLAWIAAGLLLVVGPLTRAEHAVAVVTPALAVYVLFAGRRIRWVRTILETRPFQLVGAASYSLYLWQQLVLASPSAYDQAPIPVWWVLVAVPLSVLLVERPFIRIGHRLSRLAGARAVSPGPAPVL